MNKELALRTFAYLIRHYKTHNATIINKQEIEAIEFILNDNEFLEQQLHDASIQIQELIEKDIWCPSNCEKLEKLQQENKQLKDNWNKLKEWLKEYEEGTYGLGSYETGLSDGLGDVIKKMQELEGSDNK
jgi:hypothetical protein